ncbi:MAG: hypothetical protein WBQ94_27375 [Terracidiphilus sp.]
MNEKTENPLNESRVAPDRDSEHANLDMLIDNALATYTAGEPCLDLSARILSAAHVLEPRRRPGFQLRPWAFAAAGWLTAAAMLLVWINARNRQIIVQLRPATTQLALSAPVRLSPLPTPASASFKAAQEKPGHEQPGPRVTRLQQAPRAAVSKQHAQLSDGDPILPPITFAPIIIAPIGSGERN